MTGVTARQGARRRGPVGGAGFGILLILSAVVASAPLAVRAQEQEDGSSPFRMGTRLLLVSSFRCNLDFPQFCNAGAAPNTVLAWPPTGPVTGSVSTIHIPSTHLDGPFGLALHPLRGTLLVASRTGNRIDEFNARTGAWIRTFASRNAENDMNSPQYMVFKRNSDHLLVGVHPNANFPLAIDGIIEFDGDGNYVGVFVPNTFCPVGANGVPGGGDDMPYTHALESAASMTWGLKGTAHENQLFVNSQNTNRVIRYNADGCYLNTMNAFLLRPEGITVRPAGSLNASGQPNAGNLLVTTLYPTDDQVSQTHGIIEFNPTTNAWVPGFHGTNPSGYAFAIGLGFPGSLHWDPDGRLLVGDRFWYYQQSTQYSDRIRRLNQLNGLHVSYVQTTSGASPDRKLRASEGMITIAYGFATGDYNNDAQVNFADFVEFQNCFGNFNPPAACLGPFDDNLTGIIDLADYDAFVANCGDPNNCTSINTCGGQPNGTECDDGNACTENDSCQGNVCVGGPATDCDDDNECTVDSCNSLTGCENAPSSGSCDDGDACTVGDACINGLCTPGSPRTCNDFNACTTDSCDPGSGCVFAFNTNPCNDGDACTTMDACAMGTCAGQPLTCDDLNPCTADTCVPATGCVFEPIPCGGACCSESGCTQVESAGECGFVCNVAEYLPETFAGCYGDVDGNGFVNAADRGFISAAAGTSDPVLICRYDMDGNGFVNAGDRGFISAQVGRCDPLPDYMSGTGLNGGEPDDRFGDGVFLGEGTSCETDPCP